MTLTDWINKYKEITGEQFMLLPNYIFMASIEHGFIMYRIVDDTMWINQCCGHQEYWKPILFSLAKINNCKQFKTTTTHNPKLFARLFKAKQIHEYKDSHGQSHYIFAKEVE